MSAIDIDPQLSAALARAKGTGQSTSPADVHRQRRAHANSREWWNAGGPLIDIVREDSVPGPRRAIPVMIYKPASETPLPVFVYLHGGGYRIGDHKSNDRQMRELAAAWGGAVVSTDYAHIPEEVFPAPVEEAAAVYSWLHDHGALWGLDGDRIAFGGSSAGANVAFGAAVSLGASGRHYLKAAVGVAGLFDFDTETPSMREFGAGDATPNRNSIAALSKLYAPDRELRGDPRVDITSADPMLFPPTFLAVAELDALRDSSKTLAARITEARRFCELKVYPGMTHFFFGYSRTVDTAAEAVGDVAAFLRIQLPA